MLLPMMASRLMLSVRKAAAENTGVWSLSNMSQFSRGIPTEGGLEFASYRSGVSRKISGNGLPLRGGGDVELGTLPLETMSTGHS